MKHDELNELLAPVVAALGLELLGLEYAPHRDSALLRLFIDAEQRAITLEDCERVSREVSAVLDVNDPIRSRYTLEVSSPGIERPLFTAAHFARFIGEQAKVQVNLPIEGRRRFHGAIRKVEGDTITLDQDGVEVDLRHGNVLKANLAPKADGKPAKGPRKLR